MFECENYTNTLKVGRCGTRIWLGTYDSFVEGMQLLVVYYLGDEEISDFFEPIIEGNNVFLDLSVPGNDYYSPFQTYYISLTDVSGYFSNGLKITNNGITHNGFIVNFSDAKNANDRLVTV